MDSAAQLKAKWNWCKKRNSAVHPFRWIWLDSAGRPDDLESMWLDQRFSFHFRFINTKNEFLLKWCCYRHRWRQIFSSLALRKRWARNTTRWMPLQQKWKVLGRLINTLSEIWAQDLANWPDSRKFTSLSTTLIYRSTAPRLLWGEALFSTEIAIMKGDLKLPTQFNHRLLIMKMF